MIPAKPKFNSYRYLTVKGKRVKNIGREWVHSKYCFVSIDWSDMYLLVIFSVLIFPYFNVVLTCQLHWYIFSFPFLKSSRFSQGTVNENSLSPLFMLWVRCINPVLLAASFFF